MVEVTSMPPDYQPTRAEYDQAIAGTIEEMTWVAKQEVAKREERIAELEAALAPFARASDSYDAKEPAHVIAAEAGAILSVYDLRVAKAALG